MRKSQHSEIGYLPASSNANSVERRKSSNLTDCQVVRDLESSITKIAKLRSELWTEDSLRKGVRRSMDRVRAAKASEKKVKETMRRLAEIKRRIRNMTKELGSKDVRS